MLSNILISLNLQNFIIDYGKERNTMARKYSIMNILFLIVKTPNKFPILL